MKFTTHDVVECIKDVICAHAIKKGDRHMVRNVSPDGHIQLHGIDDPGLFFNRDYFMKYVHGSVMFSPGDRVRCLNVEGQFDDTKLKYNNVYLVEAMIGNAHVKVVNGRDSYAAWRFVKVESVPEKLVADSPFKLGDTVRCIDAKNSYGHLDQGRAYTVHFVAGVHSIQLYEKRESGLWCATRFELVPSAADQKRIVEFNDTGHFHGAPYIPAGSMIRASDIWGHKALPEPKVYKHAVVPASVFNQWPQDPMPAAIALNELR